MLRWRSEWGWPLIVGFVFVLGIWWLPGSDTTSSDTYSVAHGGKKGFFRILNKMHGNALRTPDRLATDAVGSYLILGPARYPTENEWQLLANQVANGMTLIFAARDTEPDVKIPIFQIEVATLGTSTPVPTPKVDDDADPEEANKKPKDNEEKERRVEKLFSQFKKREPQSAESSLLPTGATWTGEGYLKFDEFEWTTLVSMKGHPRVASHQYGRGTIIVCSSDEIFSNVAMLDENRSLLAYRIATSNGRLRGPIAFDESLNASGVPKVFGSLFSSGLRPITLQLFLMLVLFGWSGSRRFGPAAPAIDPPRRSIVEHAEALGSLYYRANAGTQILRRWLEWFRMELRWQSKEALSTHDLEVLARWSKMPLEEVRVILKTAVAQANDPETKNSQIAHSIQQVAMLRDRIRHHR